MLRATELSHLGDFSPGEPAPYGLTSRPCGAWFHLQAVGGALWGSNGRRPKVGGMFQINQVPGGMFQINQVPLPDEETEAARLSDTLDLMT